MERAAAITAAAVATSSLLVGCSRPDSDGVLKRAVLACVASRGGTVGDGADVAVAGGQAVAVIGPIEASDALISECLDLANP